jgi:transcriptional regulator of aromatic amino acid metabolism
MESDNNDARHITMQIAITARSTTTIGNIKSLYNDLHCKTSSSSMKQVKIVTKINKFQCIEVLPSEIEKDKKDKLWELLTSIFAFECYKYIKIVFFANELEEELHHTVDNFFERNGKCVRKMYPGFNVFTAVDQESDELKRNLKMFFQQQNGLLVTNVYISKLGT